MSFKKMDPSCTIGFYCRTVQDFEKASEEITKVGVDCSAGTGGVHCTDQGRISYTGIVLFSVVIAAFVIMRNPACFSFPWDLHVGRAQAGLGKAEGLSGAGCWPRAGLAPAGPRGGTREMGMLCFRTVVAAASPAQPQGPGGLWKQGLCMELFGLAKTGYYFLVA